MPKKHYASPEDFGFATPLLARAPLEGQAFMTLKQVTERTDGCIPAKYRELISLAVALTTQCAYCIDAHTRNAVQVGVTQEEVAETVFIATALRAGGTVGHGLMAMRLFNETNAPSGSPLTDGPGCFAKADSCPVC